MNPFVAEVATGHCVSINGQPPALIRGKTVYGTGADLELGDKWVTVDLRTVTIEPAVFPGQPVPGWRITTT